MKRHCCGASGKCLKCVMYNNLINSLMTNLCPPVAILIAIMLIILCFDNWFSLKTGFEGLLMRTVHFYTFYRIETNFKVCFFHKLMNNTAKNKFRKHSMAKKFLVAQWSEIKKSLWTASTQCNLQCIPWTSINIISVSHWVTHYTLPMVVMTVPAKKKALPRSQWLEL